MFTQLCDPIPDVQRGRGPELRDAHTHTALMSQYLSYYIRYLRAVIGGWARESEKGACVCMCVCKCMWGWGMTRKKRDSWWAIEGERWCPAVRSTLDHLYITLHWSVCMCNCVLFLYAITNPLNWDKASVRCHISKMLPFMYVTDVCVCQRERAIKSVCGGELGFCVALVQLHTALLTVCSDYALYM